MNGARGTLVAAPPGASVVPEANGFPTHEASGLQIHRPGPAFSSNQKSKIKNPQSLPLPSDLFLFLFLFL